MKTQERIELRYLAPYLPYGLKLKYNNPKSEYLSMTLCDKKGLSNIDIGSVMDNPEFYKPLLHPLDRLTQPILEGGKVPMYELIKTQGFSTKPIEKYTFEYNDQYQPIAKATDGDWMLRYMHDENAFFLNGLKDWNKKHQKSRNQLKMFEMMFSWHFDVFGLIDKGLAEPIELTDK